MTKFPNLDKLLERYRLTLASGSPRRVQLLREAGIKFRQIIPDIQEDNYAPIAPPQLAVILARRKAEAVRNNIETDEIALGCDTIVILNGNILGKPASSAKAMEMLQSLSGKRHIVCSAIALFNRHGQSVDGFELTDVYFHSISKQQIEWYISTGEPLDKAGAYGIQEQGGFLVDRIEGNVDNVIGLPMLLLDQLAEQIEVKLRKI
ncbi:MAG: Maf family protein [candidate division Zixibacteria bacterium]|nr:Maf family protein [candidate division Zixibacteria bacterium]